MNRRTFYVTAAAGAYVAGRRVDLLAPGPFGAVELELAPVEAEAYLRTGALSETPPAKKRPGTAEEASGVGSDVGGAEMPLAAAGTAGDRTLVGETGPEIFRPKGSRNGRRRN